MNAQDTSAGLKSMPWAQGHRRPGIGGGPEIQQLTLEVVLGPTSKHRCAPPRYEVGESLQEPHVADFFIIIC